MADLNHTPADTVISARSKIAMIKTAPQFEPDAQIDNALLELDKSLQDASGAIVRIERLKMRLAAEVEALRSERGRLEIYTEKDAAILLRITERQLADMRRRHDLPHCSFGNKPRYTKDQLVRICEIFEIRSKERPALRKAA